MHIWTCPYQTPQVSGWVRNFFQNPIDIISNKFCKKNFALKCIPGITLIGVLPLGQGGCPPDVGYITYLECFSFLNNSLKCIPALAHVGVLPLGQGGRPPRCWGG